MSILLKNVQVISPTTKSPLPIAKLISRALLSKLPATRAFIGTSAIACIVGLMMVGIASATPSNQLIFEDFESINSDDFSVGSDGVEAHFTDGFSAQAGISELYNSGTHAWMVNPGETGQIEFATNTAVVEFFARTRSTANGTSVLTAFDEQDNQVGDSIILNPGDRFEIFSFTGSIRRIEFTNNADSSCSDCMNSIDDFGFTPEEIFSPEAPLTLPISANQTAFSKGDTLTFDIGTSNPGLDFATGVDVYMVILFPDGDTLVSFIDLEAKLTFGKLSNLSKVIPMITSLNLTNPFSVSLSGFFSYKWTGEEPAGNYRAFLVMVKPGAFADGTIDNDDIVQSNSTGFSFNP
jgi:hypothetical protein